MTKVDTLVSTPRALAGLRVVEYGDFISAPYAAKLLADLGADVIKVEHPAAGDSSRRHGPFPGQQPDPEKSGLFLFLNGNKRGTTIDASTQQGAEELSGLIRWADVFITNLPGDRLDREGMDPVTLGDANPRLVYVNITLFGYATPRAHWKGSSLTASAASGLAHRVGDAGRAPLSPPYGAGDCWTGIHGALAALLGRRTQQATGEGQHIWISEVEVLGAVMRGAPLGEYVYLGTDRNRTGVFADLFYPWEVAPCKDGYFQIITMVDQQWALFVELMGNPSWKDDERLKDRWLAPRWAKELDAYWHPWLERHSKAYLTKLFRDNRLPFQPVQTMEEVVNSEHLHQREFWVTVIHPEAGRYVVPGAPYKLSETPWANRRPAPLLGQHNEEVRQEVAAQAGDRHHERRRSRAVPVDGRKPLAKLRVLDHGHVWAGPLLGMMLADMGAEVIKVQAPQRLSGIAMSGHATYQDAVKGDMVISSDHPLAYHSFDRGKRSITLNLADDEGKELYRRLAAISDIVTENFSPGVMDRLGLGYAELSQVNPGIVVAAMSAAGATEGPWRDAKTYGPSVSALYGLKGFLGYLDDPYPREDTADVDPDSASHALFAILAALEYRDRTGRGQFIDVAQGEAALQRAAEPLMDYFLNGRVATPQGNRYPGVAPHGIYRCMDSDEENRREKDRWVAIEAWTQEEWESLRSLIRAQRPEILDERFDDLEGRLQHQSSLDQVIESWTISRSPESVAEELQGAGIAAHSVQGLMDLVNDRNYQAVRSRIKVEAPGISPGDVLQGIPWKMSKTPGAISHPVPSPGEHNEEVFAGLLGLDCDALESARGRGVIG